MSSRLHKDEFKVDIELAKSMISVHFPKWSHLHIQPVLSSGTDNVIFRLGEEMCMRIPRTARTANNLKKEYLWLPYLRPLPLETPTPIAMGKPTNEYPCTWCIFNWIRGENAIADNLIDQHASAKELGQFIQALQKIDATSGPKSGSHNNYRGVPLLHRDQLTRESIARLTDYYNPSTLLEVWNMALEAPIWGRAPVWLHGDLHSGNMLAIKGKLSAVIDFGLSGVGDPACDLMIGWTQYSPEIREVFFNSLMIDEATYLRSKGWSLSWAVIALSYYLNTNSFIANMAKNTISQVLESQR